jgi:hypothetical protein
MNRVLHQSLGMQRRLVETLNFLKRPTIKKHWFAVYLCLLASLVLCSCASQAPADDAITNGVIDLYSKTLSAFENAATTAYSKRSAFYKDTHNSLDVLKLRAQISATRQDKTIVDGIGVLDSLYTTMEINDKSGWATAPQVKSQMIKENLDAIRQQVENIAYENAGKKAAAGVSGSPHG